MNLLRPYPQFDGDFEALPLLEASSWYNSMQIRFQKRTTHHVSFEGSYTFSKLTDDSSVGANAFVGTLNNGNPQQLDNLKAEHGISANDTPQRLAAAVIVDLPIGRKDWIGGNMNRILDGVVGGWSISDPDHGAIRPTLGDSNVKSTAHGWEPAPQRAMRRRHGDQFQPGGDPPGPVLEH